MKQRKFNLSVEIIVEFEKRERETREALELRRLQAVRLYGSGAQMAVVQQVSGASRRTVQRWVDSYEAAGLEGLKAGWKGGNHRCLSDSQRTALKCQLQNQRPNEILVTGDETQGERFWTVADVRELVEQHYGVYYRSVRSYHELLHESGLSYQRPEGIYRSRPSEAVIAEFEAEAEKK
jgi:putative transposase